MDAAVPMTATGLALVWPLLGFLLLWMILFGVLAFRPERGKEKASGTLPAGNSPLPSAPAMLHVIAAQPAPASNGSFASLSPANVVGPFVSPASDASNNN